MTRKLLLIAVLSFSLLLNFCKNTSVAPELTPGSRNYFWELDTLDMPMNYIGSVWGASPNDVWAVGAGGTEYDRLLHYDGTKWSTYTKETIWCTGNTLFGFSANDVWMGGGGGWLSKGAGIWHYDGVKWSQNYVYDVEGSYDAQVTDIWGTNPNDLYASGVISFFDGSMDVWRGFVVRYDGGRWYEIVRAQFNSQFITVRKEQDKVYLYSVGVNYESPSVIDYLDLEFYQLDGDKLKKIYSNKEAQINAISLYTINAKAYFVIDRDVFRYVNGRFVKYMSIGLESFGYQICGRNEKDLFLRMKDGIAHHNGVDIEYLYNFPLYSINLNKESVLFEKEVFFCGLSQDFKNLVLHGRLKE
jgi:hypothetical protein